MRFTGSGTGGAAADRRGDPAGQPGIGTASRGLALAVRSASPRSHSAAAADLEGGVCVCVCVILLIPVLYRPVFVPANREFWRVALSRPPSLSLLYAFSVKKILTVNQPKIKDRKGDDAADSGGRDSKLSSP